MKMRQINFNRPPRFFSTQPNCCLWMIVLCLGLSLLACGGSKQTKAPETTEGEVDIDKLLSTPADEEKQNAEDAEVLRLLGITPENANTDAPKMEPQVTETKTEPAQPGMPDLQKEVDRLQSELNVKNQQIADLRSSLMEREAKLQDLERSSQTSATRGASGGNGFVQRYADARNLYEQRRYAEAAAAFQAILAENDKGSYADNCQYWIGESYYGLGKFPQAIAEFEKVFTFARSNKTDAALLKIGLCYLQMGERQQARSQLEQLIATYPSSPYVAKARRYLARL
jgi:tol-pal system protein YbgF